MQDFRLGLSICNRPLTEESFDEYAKAQIKCIELSGANETIENLDWKSVELRSKEFGIELWSLHLPFLPFEILDPASQNKDKRTYTLNYFSEFVKKAGDIGIKTIVVHPSAEPIQENDREESLKCSADTLAKLADIADDFGGQIAVENLPRTCLGRDSYDILKILSFDDRLRACFDTNHLLKEDIIEFIHKVGNKLITTHVSDFDFKNERHWLPGEGSVDWISLIDALRKIDYSGPWLYELGYNAPDTINRRDLTAEDFKYNYDMLMNGKVPQPLGFPIKEKCTHWLGL